MWFESTPLQAGSAAKLPRRSRRVFEQSDALWQAEAKLRLANLNARFTDVTGAIHAIDDGFTQEHILGVSGDNWSTESADVTWFDNSATMRSVLVDSSSTNGVEPARIVWTVMWGRQDDVWRVLSSHASFRKQVEV